jgi:NADH-quinone oxidoreductase subunit E
MMVNWEFFDNQTPQSARQVVDDLRAGTPVSPTRGAASVCTFKQMARVLAGFPDGRADEGVGAGEASLVGLRLAKERGWSAPSSEASGSSAQDASEEVAAQHVADPPAPSSSDAAVGAGRDGAAPVDADSEPDGEGEA